MRLRPPPRLIFERLAYTRLVLKKLSGAVDKTTDVIRKIQGPSISDQRGQLNIGLTKNTTTLVRHSRSCGAVRIIRHIKLYVAGSRSCSTRSLTRRIFFRRDRQSVLFRKSSPPPFLFSLLFFFFFYSFRFCTFRFAALARQQSAANKQRTLRRFDARIDELFGRAVKNDSAHRSWPRKFLR